ncbi:hypothetical protein DM860_014936 [Cuscuta australis]|uniref:MADS-box domain-containing protein n=1 Tax=Cuscuta australis TaxID=267555 RepID=A0A328E662_9ASTE|nr:hypothetical protein DM860_014936 [Cuscuta australis]
MAMGMKKASLGRQKIKMAKIEVKNHLQVTFSKRRSGLFKKASELCTLCGVEIAIIVFSPAGKVFSFGHPHVESIIDRFLSKKNNDNNNNSRCGSYSEHPDAAVVNLVEANRSAKRCDGELCGGPPQQPDTAMVNLVEAHRNASVREMNMTLTQMIAELEAEKKRGETLDEMRKESRSQCWWEAPIIELGLEELELLRNAMGELGKVVGAQIAEVVDGTSKLLAMNNAMLNEFAAETKPQGILVNSCNNAAHHSMYSFRFDHGFF